MANSPPHQKIATEKNGTNLAICTHQFIVVTKYSDHMNLRKEGELLAHSSRVQFIIMGQSWQQEPEVTGYVVSTVRKRRARNADAQLAIFSFT